MPDMPPYLVRAGEYVLSPDRYYTDWFARSIDRQQADNKDPPVRGGAEQASIPG
jgi:hypothetical protein